MLEIMNVQDFLGLQTGMQQEILKSIRTKDRLETWLRSKNGKARESGKWIPCVHCAPGEPGVCKHCKPFDHPGWIWLDDSYDGSDIHPSSINKCMKYSWFSCSGYSGQMEEHIDPRLQMIFDLGTAWHHVVQRFYGQKGAWGDTQHYQPEAQIDPEALAFDGTPILPIAHAYWIRGHVDALLHRYEMDIPGIGPVALRVIHEYKTINNGGYGKLTRPLPHHKWQATLYAGVFGVPIVVYLYLNKDNSQMADFNVPFEPMLWTEIVKKIETVQYYTENKIIPPWELTSAQLNPSECLECPYRKVCGPPLKRATEMLRLT